MKSSVSFIAWNIIFRSRVIRLHYHPFAMNWGTKKKSLSDSRSKDWNVVGCLFIYLFMWLQKPFYRADLCHIYRHYRRVIRRAVPAFNPYHNRRIFNNSMQMYRAADFSKRPTGQRRWGLRRFIRSIWLENKMQAKYCKYFQKLTVRCFVFLADGRVRKIYLLRKRMIHSYSWPFTISKPEEKISLV